jgi:hypothetical protein
VSDAGVRVAEASAGAGQRGNTAVRGSSQQANAGEQRWIVALIRDSLDIAQVY